MLDSVLSSLIATITHFISSMGYWGIGICMAIESCNLPLPSEVILPFGGYLVYKGSLTYLGASLAGTIGGLVGSIISYYIGLFGGRTFLERYGRYLGISLHRLAQADRWFENYGKETIFITRLLPGIRTFISLPAGAARMNIGYFVIYTFLGSFIWSLLLTYAGIKLGKHWETLSTWFHKVDIGLAAGLLLLVIFYIWKLRRRRKLS